MTNRLAIVLALLVALGLAADWYWTGGTYALYLARRIRDLIDYMAFWR